jgi:hypothetical protein
MKAIIAVYIVVLTCGLSEAKRRNNVAASMHTSPLAYTQQITPQYYDRPSGIGSSSNSYLQPQAPSQYLSNPYQPSQQHVVDDYNYNRNFYNFPSQQQQQQQQQDYQEPLYGYPTFRGDYNPKPYYFAQPSYMSQDDRLEATNPLDYLQAEIIQENERERNNAAFLNNLALYNRKLDSLQARQQQIQQFENAYNLKPSSEFDDYEMEQPSDWYDQTSILVDPGTYESFKGDSNYLNEPQFQYQQWQPHSSDYDDEMVRELSELKEMKQQSRNAAATKKKAKQQQKQQQRKDSYRNLDWQRDMPQTSNNDEEEISEPENYDDEWINWGGQKRSIQPKKEIKQEGSSSTAIPSTSTTTISSSSTTTEKSKLLGKLHAKFNGQKEVVLPRPATPVRKPFSEAVMKSMGGNLLDSQEEQQTPPIYKTIKQIIDMEQNLSHVSRLFFLLFMMVQEGGMS